ALGLPRPRRHGGTLPLAGEQVRERRAPGAAADDGDAGHTTPPAECGLRIADCGMCERTSRLRIRNPKSAIRNSWVTQPRPFSYETDSPCPPAAAGCSPGACTPAAAPVRSPPRACSARPARRDAPT